MLVQILIEKGGNWQKRAASIIDKGIIDPVTKRVLAHPQKPLITKKISHDGFKVGIRLLSSGQYQEIALSLLKGLAGSFGAFGLAEGNSFSLWRPRFYQKKVF